MDHSKLTIAFAFSAGMAMAEDRLPEGDPEYGAFLSTECMTCHQTSGESDGIPPIAGQSIQAFSAALRAYRSKERMHPVMNMIASRLTDTDIAALAAYYESPE